MNYILFFPIGRYFTRFSTEEWMAPGRGTVLQWDPNNDCGWGHRLLSGPIPNVNQSPCRKESQIISVRSYCKNFHPYQMCVIQEKKSLNTPRLHLHFSLLSSYYKLLVPPETSFWSYSNRSTKLKRDSLALYMYIHAHEKNSADYICDHSTCCCCAPLSIPFKPPWN